MKDLRTLAGVLKVAAVEQQLLRHDCCSFRNNGAIKKGKLGADKHIIVGQSEFIL